MKDARNQKLSKHIDTFIIIITSWTTDMLALTRSIRSSHRSICAASTRTVRRVQQQQRAFASEPTIKRPRAIKVKKSEARRRVEPKSEAESQQHALTEAPQAQPPTPFVPYEQPQEPVTFGQILKSVRPAAFSMAQ